MDLATIIGLVGGSGLVLSAIIMGGSAKIFLNIPGMLIVFGGTLAVSFIKFSMGDVINSIKVAMKAFMAKLDQPEKVIEEMISYAKIAKNEGLIALESKKPKDAFAAKALRYLSDGLDQGLIEDMLNKDIEIMLQRHATGQGVFKGMGDSAPAFGMIGTLIGLVQMLASMDNPSSIGPAMAVALLTTLYGALAANFICMPLADKLALRSQEELVNKRIIREAAVGIAKGISAMVLEESLKIYLSPKSRNGKNAEKGGKKK